MKIQFRNGAIHDMDHRCLVIFATSDGQTINGGEKAAELLKPFIADGEFGKGFGGTIYLANPEGFAAKRLLFFNMGKEIKKSNDFRKAGGKAWKFLRGKGFKEVATSLDGLADDDQTRALVEGFALGEYVFLDFKTEKDEYPNRLETLTLHATKDASEKVNRWHAIADATCRARDLCQMPANVLNPSHLANLVQEWAGSSGYEATILEQVAIEEEKMGALLSVSQGSDTPPRFIVMDYKPANPSGKTFVLVGKAVTFDSGGLNIKTAMMEEMKGDMGGGATVVGIMSALRAIGCPHRVVGLVPSVENMPSGKATRPSDVVTSKAGITIEVNNTDAEGRLIMVDALAYASRYEPDYVIDFATLTGACLVALGPKIYGVLGNHQPLVDAIVKTSWELHEPFWQLPLYDGYKDMLKSDTADISNVGKTRFGGTITAGLFLERWAKDFKWAHCDIAAGIFDKADDYNPSGGIGAGVRTIIEVFDQMD